MLFYIILYFIVGQWNKTYQTARVETGLEVPCEALYLFYKLMKLQNYYYYTATNEHMPIAWSSGVFTWLNIVKLRRSAGQAILHTQFQERRPENICFTRGTLSTREGFSQLWVRLQLTNDTKLEIFKSQSSFSNLKEYVKSLIDLSVVCQREKVWDLL